MQAADEARRSDAANRPEQRIEAVLQLGEDRAGRLPVHSAIEGMPLDGAGGCRSELDCAGLALPFATHAYLMMNCPFRNTHPRLSHRHSVCCSLPCPPTSPHPQDEQEPPAVGAPSTMRCPRGGSTAFPRWCGRLQLDVERSRVRLIILRRDAVDAGSALLAGQPVGLHHPIQRLSPRNWERRSSCDRGDVGDLQARPRHAAVVRRAAFGSRD